MDFEETVKKRRAIREYDNKPVTDEQIRKIFGMVTLSPSAMNLQHWDFLVIKDPERRKALRNCANNQKHIEEAPVDIIVLGNSDVLAHLDEVVVDPARKERVKELAKLPLEKRRMFAQQNANLAAMTLMLAAQSIGLSTCPMTGFDSEKVRKEFNIPGKYEIVMILPLGYGKNIPPTPPKRSVESIMHFEKL